MPVAAAVVPFNYLTSSASVSLTTAGIAYGIGNLEVIIVPPPNLAYARSSFIIFRTPTILNVPYGLGTLLTIKPSITAVLTPGFIASCNINFGFIVNAALVSPSILTEGLYPSYQYGVQTVGNGPPVGIQVPINSIGLATSVAASGSTTSVVIPSYYFPHITFGVTSTQAGAINIQRYIDTGGLVANGSALTASLTANTAAVVDSQSILGFGSFTIQVTNTGASTATLSGLVLLLLAR